MGETWSRYAGQGGVQCLFTGPVPLLINTGVLICSISDLDNLLCASWLYYLIVLPILLGQLLPHLLASLPLSAGIKGVRLRSKQSY